MVDSPSDSPSDSPPDSDSHPHPAWRGLLLTAGLLCSASAAWAQPALPAARASQPDPTDARASVAPLAYVSSLQPDARQAERPPLTWREANDRVARIGGWRVYAREAQLPDAAPTPAPPAKPTDPAGVPKPTPMPAGHGGHKTP